MLKISDIFSIHGDMYKTTITFCGLKFKLKNHKTNMHRLVQYHLSLSLCAANQHKKTFEKYKNINRGKDVVLVATGPSLENFTPIKEALYLGVNRAFEFPKVKFNYLFLQDYSGVTPEYIKDFLDYEKKTTKKFLGVGSYLERPKSVIPDMYFEAENVEKYYSDSHSTQDFYAHDLSTQMLGESGSVVFPAMQFLLYTHPRRIYLVGCDCTKAGYYAYRRKNNLSVDLVYQGWKNLKIFASAFYPDIEIISVNPVGLKGLFKDIYQ